MAEITEYVQSTIVIKDASPGIPNFGALLLLANSDDGDAGLHLISATPAGIGAWVDTYGGDTNDIGYKMLDTIVAQDRHVPEALWYNGKSALTDSVVITPLGPFIEGKPYTITVNGSKLSYTCDAGDAAADVATALHTAANALTDVASTDGTGSFTLAGATAGDLVYLSAYSSKNFSVAVGDSSAGDASDQLAAAAAANPDFYGVLLDVKDATSIADAAAWAETNKKLLVVRVQDSAALGGTGVLDTLFQAGYHRTAVCFSEDDNARFDAALLGRFLSTTPGASDPQFKAAAKVTPSDLSASQFAALKAKNGISYTRTLGVAFADNGVAVSGRPLALTRNVDWLNARLEQLALTVFLNQEITPLNSTGITLIENAIRQGLSEAEVRGIVEPGWTVIAPSAADITADLKAQGLFPTFQWSAISIVAGRKAIIEGQVS